jgi:hypothetical protein
MQIHGRGTSEYPLGQRHLDIRLLAELDEEPEPGDDPLVFVPFRNYIGVYNYVRTRLFSPSSPGESFFLAISGQLSAASFSSGSAARVILAES